MNSGPTGTIARPRCRNRFKYNHCLRINCIDCANSTFTRAQPLKPAENQIRTRSMPLLRKSASHPKANKFRRTVDSKSTLRHSRRTVCTWTWLGGNVFRVQSSRFRDKEVRIWECAGTTALWNDATCRVGGKRRPVAAVQTLAIQIGLNWVRFHFLKKSKLVKSSMFNRGLAFFELGSFSRFHVFNQHIAGSLFLNTEGNEGNEVKTGTEIKIRKVGKQERMKTSNSKPQAPSAQTPTVADDVINLFITRDFNRG
jgi:hypothetical protein